MPMKVEIADERSERVIEMAQGRISAKPNSLSLDPDAPSLETSLRRFTNILRLSLIINFETPFS